MISIPSLGKKLIQLLSQLATDPPRTGRMIAEDGTVINEAEHLRSQPINIARGLLPGASPIGSFGERTTTGGEDKFPIWPNGRLVALPLTGVQMSLQSTDPEDAPGGAGIHSVEIHYLDGDLDPKAETVTLDGTTSVLTEATDIRWIQCMHIKEFGSTAAAVGIVTAEFGADVYSIIATAGTRCSSAFRMVPRGKVLYIDGAAASSISGTADAKSVLNIVASEIFTHKYHNPLVFIPFTAVGVQNGPATFNIPPGRPFTEGTLVGGIHTSDKAATVTLSWFGRLENAPDGIVSPDGVAE